MSARIAVVYLIGLYLLIVIISMPVAFGQTALSLEPETDAVLSEKKIVEAPQADPESWYQILIDSKLTDRQWLEAAGNIVRPVPVPPTAPGTKPKSSSTAQELSKDRPLQGEVLRTRKDPTVTELLIKRADEITSSELKSSRLDRLEVACLLTRCLTKWDIQAALPEIRKRLNQCHELDVHPHYSQDSSRLHGLVCKLVIAAVDSGATEFIDAYIGWVNDVNPTLDWRDSGNAILQPLGRYPDNPKMAELSRKLFSAGSPWLPRKLHQVSSWRMLLTSSLLTVPTFRDWVQSQLADKQPFGTATVDREVFSVELNYSGGQSSELIYTDFDADARYLSDPQPVRVCDFVAWRLSHLAGAPLYELWWYKSKRDAVLSQMKQFVDDRGSAYRDLGLSNHTFGNFSEDCEFRMPQLDRAATPADVAANQAIFSLTETFKEVRAVKLENHPQVARWKTLTTFPIRALGPPDPKTGMLTRIKSLDQRGLIWQAEEALVDGRWQRFYGFVGTHIIAKVPAEEIEFVE